MTGTVYGISSTAMSLRTLETIHIQTVLNKFKGNITKTSQSLGVSRPGLYYKMKTYGIDVKSIKNNY